MPTLDSYIFFDGQCAEAMRRYAQVLGGTLQALMTYAQSPQPEQCPPGSADRVMHACIAMPDGRLLMASDSPAGQHRPMAGFALSLTYPTADEAQRVFAQLADGGQVQMPAGPTFWADVFGMCTDRWGTRWFVSGGPRPVPQA